MLGGGDSLEKRAGRRTPRDGCDSRRARSFFSKKMTRIAQVPGVAEEGTGPVSREVHAAASAPTREYLETLDAARSGPRETGGSTELPRLAKLSERFQTEE